MIQPTRGMFADHLTTAEFARHTGMSKELVLRLISDGAIHASRVRVAGFRVKARWYIPQSELSKVSIEASTQTQTHTKP